MKDPITTPGKTYAVTSPNGCTVTTEDGITLAEIEAGKQGYFVAVSGKVQLSDEAAVLTQVFKLAPQQRLAILGVLGGGTGLPAGYKRVEYLDCKRNVVQYIETPIFIDKECEVSASFFGEEAVIISRTSQLEGKGILEMQSIYHEYYASQRFGEKPPYNIIQLKMMANVGQINRCANSAAGSSINDTYIERNAIIQSSGLTRAMFFMHSANDPGYKGARIFECAISKKGKALFKAIPCLDPTGAPCMFDLVSRKPFYNHGTGDFLYPTETATYSLRRVLPDWGKLTEHGLRRLYHAPAGYAGELYDYAIENGYKPIVETEQPEEGYWAPRWTETEDEIILEWVETEPPMDEDLTETE